MSVTDIWFKVSDSCKNSKCARHIDERVDVIDWESVLLLTCMSRVCSGAVLLKPCPSDVGVYANSNMYLKKVMKSCMHDAWGALLLI